MSMPWYFSPFSAPESFDEWYWDPFAVAVEDDGPLIAIHSPAEILRKLLIDMELAVEPDLTDPDDWSVFTNAEPSKPDNVITVYDTTGVQHGRVMQGEFIEDYGIQIRFRGSDQGSIHPKARTVKVHLAEVLQPNTLVTVTTRVGTATYNVHALSKFGSLLNLGKDRTNSNLRLNTLNLMATITRTE